MKVCHMTQYKVKGKVTDTWKLQKWPISPYLLHQCVCNQSLVANCDTACHCLTLCRTDFWYLSFSVTWPSNLACSSFGKRILPLTMLWPAVLYGSYLFISWWQWHRVSEWALVSCQQVMKYTWYHCRMCCHISANEQDVDSAEVC